MSIERMSLRDQVSNSVIYGVMDIIGVDDGWVQDVKRYNFTELTTIGERSGIGLAGSSVLDVGCGTGDFFPVLESQNVSDYLGIDVLSPSIMKARARYPRGVFRQGDFLVEPYREKFDFVFCSGALTARFEGGNYDYMARMLARMNEVSKHAIAFNYLVRQGDDPKQDDLLSFLFDRSEVAKICAKIFAGYRMEMVTGKIEQDIQDTVFIIKG